MTEKANTKRTTNVLNYRRNNPEVAFFTNDVLHLICWFGQYILRVGEGNRLYMGNILATPA